MGDAVDEMGAVLERFSVDVDSYAELNAPLLFRAAEPLLDAIDLTSAERIVDLGTGTGRLLRCLQERAPHASVVGTDLVMAMLQRAHEDTAAPVAAMDVTRLALGDSIADVAVSAFVLRFLTDPTEALREQHRVLRVGGVAGVVVWGTAADATHEALFDEVLDEHGAAPYVFGRPLTDKLLDDPDKLRAAMEAAGFPRPRTRAAELVWSFTAQSFLDYAQRALDHFRQRCASLDPQTRRRALRVAADRLVTAGLATGEDRSGVVYGIATR
jgi:SAM-dependent methyltransferase